MKYIILFILIPCILSAGLFESDYSKSLAEKTRAEMKELLVEKHEKFEALKKDYNILYKHDNKVLDAYKSITKKPVFLHNIHFSVSAGLSAILKEDNLYKSNIDFLISTSFYYKYMKYSIGYMPVNKQIFLSLGIFF